MYIDHFGIRIKEKPTNNINKEIYLSAKPEGLRGWKEEHYPLQRMRAEINFDANILYFSSLDKNDFLSYIEKCVKKFKFKECTNLNDLNYIEGIYMLVLDKYKQIYIGQSTNIKNRIISHWNGQKSLERLIFGDICNSKLSIDSFGALDITRIFYIKTASCFTLEEKILGKLDNRYTLNRTAGGIGSVDTYTDNKKSAELAILANRKDRDLIPFINISKLKNTVSENDFKWYIKKYPQLLDSVQKGSL